MSDKYRDKELGLTMDVLETLLSSIAGKETMNLNVSEILKRDPEMSFLKATQIGMMENAQKAQVKLAALGTCFDRVVKMVEMMADEMGADGNENGERYRKRLEILLQLDKNYRKFI